MGANDGAGGTAAVIEIARALRKAKRPKGAPEIRFVFFDGEEATDDTRPFEATALRGSQGVRPAPRQGDPRARAARLRRREGRDADPARGGLGPEAVGAPARGGPARRHRARRSRPASSGEVTDDHTPFARRGIPAIDLIDFTFPCWHKTCDDLSAVSEDSLDISGEAVFEMLRAWR